MFKSRQSENLHGAGKKGLITTIIVIVVALIILGYFGFDVTKIISGPAVQANLHTAWNFVIYVWNNFLAAPVIYVAKIIWKLILTGLSTIATK